MQIVIIYSPSRHAKPVRLSVSCGTQKKIFWKSCGQNHIGSQWLLFYRPKNKKITLFIINITTFYTLILYIKVN